MAKITSMGGRKVNKSISDSTLRKLGFDVAEIQRTGVLPISEQEYDRLKESGGTYRASATPQPTPTPPATQGGSGSGSGGNNTTASGVATPPASAPPLPGILNLQLASGQPVTWNGNTYHPDGTITPAAAQPPAAPAAPAAPEAPTAAPAAPVGPDWLWDAEQFQIPGVTLPNAAQVNPNFSGDFQNWWLQNRAESTNDIGKFYEWGDWPTMQAAQLDTRRIPQPDAERAQAAQWNLGNIPQADTAMAQAALLDPASVPRGTAAIPESFDSLDWLRQGEGFAPDVLARLNAGATDAAADVGRSAQGSARLAAQQAGLDNSPIQMAMVQQAQRRQGDATTRAQNEIAIADATRGLENLRLGTGMELDRRTTGAGMQNQMESQNIANALQALLTNTGNQQQTNMFNAGNQNAMNQFNTGNQVNAMGQNVGNQQQTALANMAAANQMALANAQNVFTGMQQNVANTQQANQVNTGNQQDRNMARAGAQAGVHSNLTGQMGSAALNRQNQADFFNAEGLNNRNLNQAQLDRQRDMFNTGTGENRYGQAFSGLLGLINGQNPQGYNLAGANQQFQPNFATGNIFGNLGNTLLNWPQQQRQQ